MAGSRGFFKRLVGGDAAPGSAPDAATAPPEDGPDGIPPASDATAKVGWFQRLKAGLARTSNALSQSLSSISKRKLDAAALDDLEDTLMRADLGPETAASSLR